MSVASYAKHLVQSLKAQSTWAEVEDQLGIKKPQLYLIVEGNGKGLGPRAEQRLADKWHKGSIDAFRKAAAGWPDEPRLASVDYDPRGLGRGLFIERKRKEGVSEERLAEFLTDFDERPFNKAGNTSNWWLTEHETAWETIQAGNKGKGKGGPFGVGK